VVDAERQTLTEAHAGQEDDPPTPPGDRHVAADDGRGRKDGKTTNV
jgi:hypothetical protein